MGQSPRPGVRSRSDAGICRDQVFVSPSVHSPPSASSITSLCTECLVEAVRLDHEGIAGPGLVGDASLDFHVGSASSRSRGSKIAFAITARRTAERASPHDRAARFRVGCTIRGHVGLDH
jgi:hypothetical protein